MTPSKSLPDRRFPRIIGFEVPPLKATVDVVRDAPIVGLLDVEPSDEWIQAFNLQATALKGELGLAEISIEGQRIFFFGSTANGRRLAGAVRAFVDQVSRLSVDARLAGTAAGDAAFTHESTAGRPDAGMRTVLVVEDDDMLRTLACEVLAGADWRTLEAADAAGALAILAAEPVDALFTDVDMPGSMNGLGLADLVFERWPSVGLVVTSGRYTVDAGRVPRGGVFLSKPYQRRQLLAVIALVTHAASSRA